MRQNDIPIVAKLLQRIKELEECKINPSKHCPHFHKAMVNGVNLIELQAHLDNLIKKVEKQDKMERAYVKQAEEKVAKLQKELKELKIESNHEHEVTEGEIAKLQKENFGLKCIIRKNHVIDMDEADYIAFVEKHTQLETKYYELQKRFTELEKRAGDIKKLKEIVHSMDTLKKFNSCEHCCEAISKSILEGKE